MENSFESDGKGALTMSHTEILTEIGRLSIFDQLSLIKDAVQLLEEHLRNSAQETTEKLPLEEAAALLLSDYENDEELTAFTSLDGEEVYAAG